MIKGLFKFPTTTKIKGLFNQTVIEELFKFPTTTVIVGLFNQVPKQFYFVKYDVTFVNNNFMKLLWPRCYRLWSIWPLICHREIIIILDNLGCVIIWVPTCESLCRWLSLKELKNLGYLRLLKYYRYLEFSLQNHCSLLHVVLGLDWLIYLLLQMILFFFFKNFWS